MSDYVPQEVLFEILLRVPVKSLLICRCVSKSWYTLISHPDFISHHTKQTLVYNNNSTHLFLRRYVGDENSKKENFTLHYDEDGLFSDYQRVDFPFQSDKDYFKIVGSCNGVLCLTDNHTKKLKPILLWNPSIGISVRLPLQCITINYDFREILGFGIDPIKNDYKVVRIVYSGISDKSLIIPSDVEVYELSKGAWRVISPGSLPNCFLPKPSSAFINGSVHWIGQRDSSITVISLFDLSEEIFGEFEMPTELADDKPKHLSVKVIGMMLSILQYKRWTRAVGYRSCCIWVMNEYGVADSWTKLFNVELWSGIGRILRLRNNGEILLTRGDGELVSYDPCNHAITKLEMHGESNSFFADTYMGSLVLLRGRKRLTGRSSRGY